ncbi:MAG: aldo/keto reductase [Salinarimonas sp.]
MTQRSDSRTRMPTAPLGRGGPIVSRFALGTMTFGVETDEAGAFRQLDMFVDHGGTFIDTADVYAGGMSEEIIGRWGKQRGGMGDLVLATKGRFGPPAGSTGASRRALTRCVDASLRRLQVDAIDLYFVHGWDKDVDVAETLATLRDLVAAGKIHHIAWSNLAGWQLERIVTTARMGGYPPPVCVQPHYNMLERGAELELIPCALEAGIGLTPWSPLGGGWLTGKYNSSTRPSGATRLGEDPNRGVEAYDLRNTDRTYAVLDVLRGIAERHGRPLSHVALAWLMSRPGVAAILLGARTTEQLEENLDAADLVLEPSEIAALTEVSARGVPAYPYQFLQDWAGMDVWKRLGS